MKATSLFGLALLLSAKAVADIPTKRPARKEGCHPARPDMGLLHPRYTKGRKPCFTRGGHSGYIARTKSPSQGGRGS